MEKTLEQKFEEAARAPVSDEGIIRSSHRNAHAAPQDKAPPTTDENPRHKEDFNYLLDAAVKGPQSNDQT